MKKKIKLFDLSGYIPRWVSYLDLLGFKEIVLTKDWMDVFLYYAKAVQNCAKDLGFTPEIEKPWFSDTFLMYSSDNSAPSFTAIEATTRWFIYFLICSGIPVRGAMACGDFYAEKINSVFFGQALIEAYHYGENQDWIGFILAPSAVNQMALIGLPASERLNYAYWSIPYKGGKGGDINLQESLPAYIIGGHTTINNRNPCLDKLLVMKGQQKDATIIRKYENTINFIEANKRTP